MKRSKIQALALVATLILTLIISGCNDSSNAASAPIRIGSKDFTENLIVAELYALSLENAGFTVERTFNLASSVVHTTLVNNEIDLYPEYTGTGLLAVLKHELVTDPDEVFNIVKTEYESQFKLVWLDYAKANDGQGLVITAKASEAYGIKTISDLQKNSDKIRFASQGEFDIRDDGIPALEAKYGSFNFISSKVYDNALKYEVLANDEADVAPAYTTEGSLTDPKFVLLEDDLYVWPPYNLAPVVRQEALTQNPGIEAALNKVSQALDTPTITALNAKVDVDKQEYEAVAKEYFGSIKQRP
jgi:osmoprotectant transport system substrate-binding protein